MRFSDRVTFRKERIFSLRNMDEKYDTALLGILQHEGKIEKFLHVVFGFLYRRTDFYRLMKSKEDQLGFPPGVALKMLTSIFQQYDAMTRQDDSVREARNEEANMRKKQPISPADPVKQSSDNVAKKNLGSRDSSEQKSRSTASTTTNTNTQTANVHCDPVKPDKIDADNNQFQTNSEQVLCDKDNKESNSVDSSESKSGGRSKQKPVSEEEDENPELTKQQQMFQTNPESYNGAVRDNYSWSQSITDLDLRVKVPSYIRKGKDVKVDIGKKHVKVEHRDETGQWVTVVNGELCWEVNKEESMWTLNPAENVHINFEKKQERWWEAVFPDEPKINVRKIDASRPMSDLDDEAQAKIEEMMYNDRRKKMGLPTSQDEKMHEMMRKAWDAEGSPFKGQPFDPSKFSMDPSGVINMKP